MIRKQIRSLIRGELGQDLSEYCLITALLALVALGIFVHASGGVHAIWSTAGSRLAQGSSTGAATSNAPASAPASR
jgi:Flp pilus assembly pilin Flp